MVVMIACGDVFHCNLIQNLMAKFNITFQSVLIVFKNLNI